MPARILVVGDDSLAAELICETLRSADMDASFLTSSTEGLSARTILQLIRTDLFAYDPHLEVWRWRDGPSNPQTLLVRARAQSQEGNHSLA